MPKIFTPAQIDQFINDGYVILRNAFPSEVAAQCRDILWRHMNLDPNNPATWKEPLVAIRECFEIPPFSEALTPRLHAAFDQLLGENRWNPNNKVGGWPIFFPGFHTGEWKPHDGWHVDGNWFTHHLTSHDQGILPILLFSDINPGDGGTAISLGSHHQTARLLAASEPRGIPYAELGPLIAAQPHPRVIEVTGRAGDVALMHPFMMHSSSTNIGTRVRFICNPPISLKQPMQLDRPDNNYSPVERAILAALATTTSPTN